MRVTVHVRPGSTRIGVGGSHDGKLLILVRERAVDGRATEAARRALASALDLPPRDVRLTGGATSRTKVFEVPDDVAAAIDALRLSPPTGPPRGR